MKLFTIASAFTIAAGALGAGASHAQSSLTLGAAGTGTPYDPTRLTLAGSATGQVGPVTVTGAAGATYNPANGQLVPNATLNFSYQSKK